MTSFIIITGTSNRPSPIRVFLNKEGVLGIPHSQPHVHHSILLDIMHSIQYGVFIVIHPHLMRCISEMAWGLQYMEKRERGERAEPPIFGVRVLSLFSFEKK